MVPARRSSKAEQSPLLSSVHEEHREEAPALIFLASGVLSPAWVLRVPGAAGLAWACSWQRKVSVDPTAMLGGDGPAVLSTQAPPSVYELTGSS